MSGQRAETIALHGGQTADPTTKARAVPAIAEFGVYQSQFP